MADKKMVEEITSMEVDFAQWYTDVVKKAELIDYTSVKGCMVIKPAGYAIWELIQKQLDARFKETGVENVYLPMFIPESLLQKEKDHVEGFAPEVAWVTHGGLSPLQERLCVRPTSETLFCDFYKNDIQSYRDLPRVYNQWCSVVRWEKETRPFLRSREFLWQEGHTAHATAEEAQERTIQMLNLYADFCEEVLAIPVIRGQKTEKEKFAGAVATYAIEALMHDGKALQAGTSHNFGDGFAHAFGVQFADRDNTLKYVHQTSWGMTTRLIGAIIMVHGDNEGLVLPPRVAPVQVCIIPIQQKKEGVLDKAFELREMLGKHFRVKVDDTDKSPGWKFAEAEMRGYPIRVEIGPKDLAAGKCVLCRRDTREKSIWRNWKRRRENCWKPFRGICWSGPENIGSPIPVRRSIWKSSRKFLTKSRALSRPCGAGTRHARYILRRSSASPAAACLLTRNTFRIPAYAAENLPGRWCTGDGHINVNETRTRSGGSAEMKRDTLREQAVRKERAGNDS